MKLNIKNRMKDKLFGKLEETKAKGAAGFEIAYKNFGGKQLENQKVFVPLYNTIARVALGHTEQKDIKLLEKSYYKTLLKVPVKERNKYTKSLIDYFPTLLGNLNEGRVTETDKKFLEKELRPYVESCQQQQLEIHLRDFGIKQRS